MREEMLQNSWIFPNLSHSGSDTWTGEGGVQSDSKKSEKSRFCECYDLLPTTQPRRKVQLSKLVTLLKRFGRPTHPLERIRIFYSKFHPSAAVLDHSSFGGYLLLYEGEILSKKSDFFQEDV